jgi:hypothetical protein
LIRAEEEVVEEVVEETRADKEIALEELVAAPPPNHASTSIRTQTMLTTPASYEPPPTSIPASTPPSTSERTGSDRTTSRRGADPRSNHLPVASN